MSFVDFVSGCFGPCYVVDEEDKSQQGASPCESQSNTGETPLLFGPPPHHHLYPEGLRRRNVKKKQPREDCPLEEIVISTGSPFRGTKKSFVLTTPHYPQLEPEKSAQIVKPIIPNPPIPPPLSKQKECAKTTPSSKKEVIEACPFRPGQDRYKVLLDVLKLETSHQSSQAIKLILWFKEEMSNLKKSQSKESVYLSQNELKTCLVYRILSSAKEWNSMMQFIHPFDWIDFCETNQELLQHMKIDSTLQRNLLLQEMRVYPNERMKEFFCQGLNREDPAYAEALGEICFHDPELIKRIEEQLLAFENVECEESDQSFIETFQRSIQKHFGHWIQQMREQDVIKKS